MTTKIGWWSLEIAGVELNDMDREHIGQMIIEGYNSGQIMQEEVFRCTDPDQTPADIVQEFREADIDNDCHLGPQAYYEDGQWFINCVACGAQWTVNDAEDWGGREYFFFERVSDGDEFCFNATSVEP